MEKIYFEIGYDGRSLKVTGLTKTGERVFIMFPEDIICNALNEKGFTASKEGQERINRVTINK